jgi:hypothetical protein
MIPLYGFLRGDTIGLLILASEDDTVGDLAQKLCQAARVRIDVRGALRVSYRGQRLDPRSKLKEIGISALERFDAEELP